jgi:predicted nucleotidyltransferase
MRLTRKQRQIITQATRELAGPQAVAYLFGSRLHDGLRGGDIDVLVEVPGAEAEAEALHFDIGLKLGARLECALGGRRVDVLVAGPGSPESPVLCAARAEGVRL